MAKGTWLECRMAMLVAGALALLPSTARSQALENAELQKIVRFWALDRFAVDHHRPVALSPMLNHRVLAKAAPDQCYHGLGVASTPASPGAVPCSEGVEKTNQAYVWGLAQSNGYIYFGTLANTHCLVSDAYLNQITPQENPYWVCAFASPANAPYPSDWRPPRLYRYKLPSGPLEELSAKANVGGATDPTLLNTTGIRSAGAHDGVVFFAGPALRNPSGGVPGINMFAFDGATGNLLAKQQFVDYTDIRQWLVSGGVLYTTVGTRTGGEVLRWRGANSADPAVVLDFEEVGDLDGAGAYLEYHEGRIYISTWPTGGLAGILRGPVVPPEGLTAAHKPASNWVKIWDVGQYDPDPIVARTTGGGALASFGGSLFWGTMHVPFLGYTAAARALCPEGGVCRLDANGNGAFDTDEFLATAMGAHRSIAIFRSRNPEAAAPAVEVMYGETFLPTYDALKQSYTIAFDDAHRNVAHQTPLLGASGLGNFFNAYTWTMSVYDDNLFMGTFDFGQLVRVGIADALGEVLMTPPQMQALQHLLKSNLPFTEGADIYRATLSGSVYAESLDGLGNFTNYGMRTVLVDKALNVMFLGSANPMNLHPEGGWELIGTKAK